MLVNLPVSASTPIFTFPQGFRPAYILYFAVAGGGSIGRFTLLPNGNLYYTDGPTGAGVYVGLGGMTWMAEDLDGDNNPAWTGLALQNGWTNFGQGSPPARYYVDNAGDIHLSGLINGGAQGAVLGSLSSLGIQGMWSQAHAQICSGTAGATAQVEIHSADISVAGYMSGGTNGWVSLDGIVISSPGGIWGVMPLGNGWQYYANGWPAPAFTVNKNGIVSIRGLIKGGTTAVPTILCANPFPPHASPRYQQAFLVAANNGTARLDSSWNNNVNFVGFYGSGINGYLAFQGRWFATAEGPGLAGPPGPKGDPGATGGQGLPVGGVMNTVLAKKSDADYDTQWMPVPTKDYLLLRRQASQAMTANQFNMILFDTVDGGSEANGDFAYNPTNGYLSIYHPGLYLLTGSVAVPSGATGNILLTWVTNASNQLLGGTFGIPYSGNTFSMSGAVRLSAGDSIGLSAYVNYAWTIYPGTMTLATITRLQ